MCHLRRGRLAAASRFSRSHCARASYRRAQDRRCRRCAAGFPVCERFRAEVPRLQKDPYPAYAVLSAVTDGELHGLQRNLVPSPPGTPGLRVAPHPATATWLWQDAYLVIGALVFTADRAAAFVGLHDQLTALHAWMAELNRRLPALRPGAP